jgi:prostaglandin-endoperoxide synthase 2
VNRVELLVGLFAEKHENDAVLGTLMHWMVAADAFSQALTNPLLSENVYREETFSEVGMESITRTSSFDDIVRRNTSTGNCKATFTATRVPPGGEGFPIVKTLVDTADFLFWSGWEKFFRRRQKKYGSTVFKANLLFAPAIAALDHRAIEPLFASADLVPDRPTSGFKFQLPPLPLVGELTPSMYEAGPAHDRPKSLYMRLLKARKATLVRTFNETAIEFTRRWQSLNTFSWRDELEDFTVCFLFQWYLGMRPDTKGPAALQQYFHSSSRRHCQILPLVCLFALAGLL